MASINNDRLQNADDMVSEETPLLGSTMSDPKLGASDDALLGNGRKLTQYAGGVAACMAAMATGVQMGWSSAAQDRITNCTLSVGDCPSFYVSSEAFSWISAFLAVGAMIGAVFCGQLVDVVGRKRLILCLAPVTVIGWALIAWAQAVWMYDLGRIVTGFTAGGYCIIAPMFTSEISEKSVRGALGAYFQLLITVGILLAYILDYTVTSNFYAINIVCLITPIIMGLAIFPLPETPRFYLLKQNRMEAQKSLVFYRGEAYDVDQELDQVEATLNYEKELKTPFFTAIRSRAASRGLILSLLAMVFQQFSGINAVIFYASDIFTDSGVSLDAKLSSVLTGVFQVVSTFISTFLMDRAGRKLLMLISGGVMAVSSFLLALYLYLDAEDKLGSINLKWLPIVCVVVFICAFSIGLGPIPWLYMSEVFSAQVKGAAMSIATVVNWFAVFIVTKFYEDLSNAIHMYGTFFLFAGITAVGCVCVFLFFVETKNKTLEQVQLELSGRKGSNDTDDS